MRKYFGWEYNTHKNTVRHGGVGKYFGGDDNTAVAALIRKRKSDQRADCAAFCLFWHPGQWTISMNYTNNIYSLAIHYKYKDKVCVSCLQKLQVVLVSAVIQNRSHWSTVESVVVLFFVLVLIGVIVVFLLLLSLFWWLSIVLLLLLLLLLLCWFCCLVLEH